MFRIGQEEIDAVARTLLSRDFFKINGSGKEVLNFEKEWKTYTNSEYALLMTSGFGALTSALIGMGVGPGDEVIVPAYTYIATALAVTACGAIPVVAEVDETLTLDVIDTEKKITSHTKAIIPVHIMGFPSNMDAIMALAKKHGIMVLEDACQADGGTYHGKALGAIGDAGAYSFNYFKIITSGEGGALVTDNRTIYERALIYHDASAVAFFGDQLDGISEEVFGGTEFRVSDITGAILREQLKRLPGILSDLRRNRDALSAKLCGKYTQMPSNDIAGDCGTALALRFATTEDCRAFEALCHEKGIGVSIPIDADRHVYVSWTQIMKKRGALCPAMDPFKMEVNQGLQMDYSPDMCPKSLDYLARTAYISINPDWTEEDIDKIASALLG